MIPSFQNFDQGSQSGQTFYSIADDKIFVLGNDNIYEEHIGNGFLTEIDGVTRVVGTNSFGREGVMGIKSKGEIIFSPGKNSAIRTSTRGRKRGQRALDLQRINTERTNVAIGDDSVILSGDDNRASHANSIIIGGRWNLCGGVRSVVVSGQNNYVGSQRSFIGCGIGNDISSNDSAILCGEANTIASSSHYSFIGGGYQNFVEEGLYCVIAGGDYNYVGGNYSGILSGIDNVVEERHSCIVGGKDNHIDGDYSVIGGGDNNFVDSQYCCILGGIDNRTTGSHSCILGGRNNRTNASYASVVGGRDNRANVIYSSVLAGIQNEVESAFSVILGGESNRAERDYSMIFGSKARDRIHGTMVHASCSQGDASVPVGGSQRESFVLYALPVDNGNYYNARGLDSNGSAYDFYRLPARCSVLFRASFTAISVGSGEFAAAEYIFSARRSTGPTTIEYEVRDPEPSDPNQSTMQHIFRTGAGAGAETIEFQPFMANNEDLRFRFRMTGGTSLEYNVTLNVEAIMTIGRIS